MCRCPWPEGILLEFSKLIANIDSVLLTGGEALACQLRNEGIQVVFGIPGLQLDYAVDGIASLGGAIEFWNTRHEQAAAYMADGFARGGKEIGVCMVVPGPGLLNAAAGLATAYACSSRVLVVTGQLPLGSIGKGYGMLHEVPEQSRLLASLTKWSAMARTPGEVPTLVRRAVHELRSGRPRPVGIEIPPDVLATRAQVRLIPPPDDDNDLPEPGAPDLNAAADLLGGAQFPVIVAGGGVLAARASAELQTLAEALDAPVVTTLNGRGALSDHHPLTVGPLGLARLLRRADVVLVVGSRFMSASGRVLQVAPDAKLILLNSDADDLGSPRKPDVELFGDACRTLTQLNGALCPTQGRTGQGRKMADSLRRSFDKELAAMEPQMAYVRALRRAIPEDGLLVNELTQVGYIAGLAYPVWTPGTFLTPGYQGTLGYGFPTALGAKAANPGRPVVSITGDGGFGWSLQELATARQRHIGVVVVVFNDGAFGNVMRTQRENFSGRVLGSAVENPDFVALARAFGVEACRVDQPGMLEGVVRDALEGAEPVLVEVPLGPCPSPWPLVASCTAIPEPAMAAPAIPRPSNDQVPD